MQIEYYMYRFYAEKKRLNYVLQKHKNYFFSKVKLCKLIKKNSLKIKNFKLYII